ncbi:hypothetical protein TMatcc_001017 [Talaromyces marneffei ATCC 18224]
MANIKSNATSTYKQRTATDIRTPTTHSALPPGIQRITGAENASRPVDTQISVSPFPFLSRYPPFLSKSHHCQLFASTLVTVQSV